MGPLPGTVHDIFQYFIHVEELLDNIIKETIGQVTNSENKNISTRVVHNIRFNLPDIRLADKRIHG